MKTLMILGLAGLVVNELGVTPATIFRDRKYIFMGLALTVPVFAIWTIVSALIIL